MKSLNWPSDSAEQQRQLQQDLERIELELSAHRQRGAALLLQLMQVLELLKVVTQ